MQSKIILLLKSGSSDYSLNVLKEAGVDMTSPKPVEETFAVMESYVIGWKNY